MSRRLAMLIFGFISALALSGAHAMSPDDPVLGTWELDVAKSLFTPGPG